MILLSWTVITREAICNAKTAVVWRLLKPNGILILDDVNEAWAEIKAEFDNLSSKGWRLVAADGRVGVLQSGLG